MNRKKRLAFILISFFIFNICNPELVMTISCDGEVSFEDVDYKIKYGIFLDANKKNLMTCYLDCDGSTILHNIASKTFLRSDFEDFKNIAINFTEKQIVSFISAKNKKENTVLHEAAIKNNVEFITDFIFWLGHESFEFSLIMELFKFKNIEDKNFLDLVLKNSDKKRIAEKVSDSIKCTFLEAIEIDNFFAEHGLD